jgi:hypothetical protein
LKVKENGTQRSGYRYGREEDREERDGNSVKRMGL